MLCVDCGKWKVWSWGDDPPERGYCACGAGQRKVFTGIPLITAKLEGDVLHIRNEGDAPALVRGAVFGHVDAAGNFVAEEHAIFSIEPADQSDDHVWAFEEWTRAGQARTFATCERCGWTLNPRDVDKAPPCPKVRR